MGDAMIRAKEVQAFVGRQFYSDSLPEYVDVEDWKSVQLHLSVALKYLEENKGSTPEEEGELLLAIFMGYCVAIHSDQSVSRTLERAERVLPLLVDPVLKCKLAFFCYREFPDEELMEMVQSLMEEVKRKGREDEIQLIEKLIVEL